MPADMRFFPTSRYRSFCVAAALLLALFLLPRSGQSQRLTGIDTRYSDSFREWIVYTDTDGQEGELVLRWPAPDLWDDWSYRVGEQSGRVRPKWPGRLDEWEVRGNGNTATVRAVWRDDPREWRFSSALYVFNWKSVYGNILDEWQTDERAPGYLGMYTAYEGDPRQWVIIDELDASVTLAEKLLLVFTALYQASPKI